MTIVFPGVYSMKKRFLIIAILAMFLISTLIPTSVLAINSQIKLEADSEISEPISLDGTEEVELSISYKIEYENLVGLSFIYNTLLKWKMGIRYVYGKEYATIKEAPDAIIDLSVVDSPSWCNVEIIPVNVSSKILDEFSDVEPKAKVKITIEDDAPALKSGDIKIKAEFKNEEGWKIKESLNETVFSIMAAYEPNISFDFESELEIPPENETLVLINITNNGNGETSVKIESENNPETCNLSIYPEEFTIPVGETKQINVIVETTEDFDNEIIDLKLTTKSTSNADVASKYLKEETHTCSIKVENDGSLEEADGENILPGFEVLVLFAAIAICLILLKRRK